MVCETFHQVGQPTLVAAVTVVIRRSSRCRRTRCGCPCCRRGGRGARSCPDGSLPGQRPTGCVPSGTPHTGSLRHHGGGMVCSSVCLLASETWLTEVDDAVSGD